MVNNIVIPAPAKGWFASGGKAGIHLHQEDPRLREDDSKKQALMTKSIKTAIILFVGIMFMPAFLHAAPLRIISLKPNITEILFALGVGDQVVGVSTWCDTPDKVKNLPKVADYIRPNTEAIISLHPDLIITSHENGIAAPVQYLQELGYSIKVYDFHSIGSTITSITQMGEDLGNPTAAKKITDLIHATLEKIKNKHHEPIQQKALILVGRKPMIAAATTTFFGEALSYMNATTVPIAGKIPYPTLSMESILSLQPDVIIDLSMGSEAKLESTIDWAPFSIIPAVKNNRVVTLDINQFRMGPRIPEWMTQLAQVVWP